MTDLDGRKWNVDYDACRSFVYACCFQQRVAKAAFDLAKQGQIRQLDIPWDTVRGLSQHDFKREYEHFLLIHDIRGQKGVDHLAGLHGSRRGARRTLNLLFERGAAAHRSDADAWTQAIRWTQGVRDNSITALAIVGSAMGGGFALGAVVAVADTAAVYTDTAAAKGKGDIKAALLKGAGGLLTAGVGHLKVGDRLAKAYPGMKKGVTFMVGFAAEGITEATAGMMEGKSLREAATTALAKGIIGAGAGKATGGVEAGMGRASRMVPEQMRWNDKLVLEIGRDPELMRMLARSETAMKAVIGAGGKLAEKGAEGLISSSLKKKESGRAGAPAPGAGAATAAGAGARHHGPVDNAGRNYVLSRLMRPAR